MDDRKKYILNFFIYFIIFYAFFKYLEWYIALILASVVGHVLNIAYFENTLLIGKTALKIIPACTCSLEMALFMGYVFGTPKIPIRYKVSYSIFGLIVIHVGNIIRIILIILMMKNMRFNYELLHNVISFVIFPLVLSLNWMWIYILKRKKLIG
jgi:archaeosortase D